MNRQHTRVLSMRTIGMLVLDLALICLAIFLSMHICLENGIKPWQRESLLQGLPLILALYAACYVSGGVYRMLWKYAGVHELLRLFAVCCVAGALTVAANSLIEMGISRKVLVLTSVLTLAFTGGWRLLWHWIASKKKVAPAEGAPKNALIIGAGMAGAYAVTECKADPSRYGLPVALLDDDPGKIRMRIHGVPVKGRVEEVAAIAEETKADSIIIAMPSLKGEAMRRVVDAASATKKRIYMFSSAVAIDGRSAAPAIRELNVADFLSREEVKLDTEGIRSYVEGKTILVTGGGGSIGSEICRQLMRFHPAKLLVFDIYENCAYELLYDLRLRYPDLSPVEILIGSIRDKKRLDEVFDAYHPQVVFHAAAHKHVSLMEISPAEAIKNNVIGTRNLLQSASEHGVERLVQLSTDKAVNPTNVMGATKRVTEMLIQQYAAKSKMKCMAVRFGNVLGSHGSVIPLWEQQIKHGGPVTVMDPGHTRYFMTIQEAAQLVLQTGAIAKSGAIYVLNMGTPCNILELAKKLIRFYGYEPDVDMPIKITGQRIGEKMSEELMMDDERGHMTSSSHEKIMIAPPIPFDEVDFTRNLALLAEAANHNDESAVAALEKTIGTYTPNRSSAVI